MRITDLPRVERRGTVYDGPYASPRPPFWSLLRFLMTPRPKVPSEARDAVVHSTTALSEKEMCKKPGLRFVWLGHACVLVRLPSGVTFVTDPVLEKRCGPFGGLLGPARFTPAGCTAAELARSADFALISHSHYDHLSEATVKALAEGNVSFFVPLGVQSILRDWGVAEEQVHEMGWGDQKQFQAATITCVPCKHWSNRTLWDRNETLWSSWVVADEEASVFFGGDTAYDEELSTMIGKVFGGFDLALLPIGAYEPREFLSCSHADPEEAALMARHVKASLAIGMHWGTWVLSAEPVLEPPVLLSNAAALLDVNIRAVKIGEWH